MPNDMSREMTGAERMLAACRRKPVDATPVWFMRQAGRCLADYRELRERYDILTMTRTPELCTQVTLMPVETFGVDAAVMYADIMLPLPGMGVDFQIDPGVGPIIADPLRTPADIARLRVVDAEEATPFLFESIGMVRERLEGKTAVLGFAGAPFTMASYLIEGRPSKDFARCKALMYGDPATWHQLMDTLVEVTIRYLRAQVAAGAQALQLFDSWANALGPAQYERYVLQHTRRIFDGVRDLGVPTIHFATGTVGLLEQLSAAGPDCVSVDWRLPLDEAWARIGEGCAIQGNLDPAVMLAPFDTVRAEATAVLDSAGGRHGHIFNLGHGVLPDTPPECLRRLVDFVHHTTRGRATASSATSGPVLTA